jgi:hypothetical protein
METIKRKRKTNSTKRKTNSVNRSRNIKTSTTQRETGKRKANSINTSRNKKIRKILVTECVGNLPNEIWENIFIYLSAIILNTKISLVCKVWAMIINNRHFWRNIVLDLTYCTQNNTYFDQPKHIINVLRQHKYHDIQKICVNTMFYVSTLCNIIKYCPELKILLLGPMTRSIGQSDERYKSNILSNLEIQRIKSNNLQELYIHQYLHTERLNSSDNVFEGFDKLTKLTIEKIFSGSITKIIQSISHIYLNLLYLRIGTTTLSVTDSILLDIIKKMRQLQVLHIHPCKNITEKGFVDFAKEANNITFLQFYGCNNISNNIIEAFITHCPMLKTLEILGTGMIKQNINSQIYRSLELKNLHAVNIPLCTAKSNYGCNINDNNRWRTIIFFYKLLSTCLNVPSLNFLTHTKAYFAEMFNDIYSSDVYHNSLKLLFLVQRYEEIIYQHSVTINDYLRYCCQKIIDCKVACENRRMYQKKYYPYSVSDFNKDFKFIEEFMLVWFVKQQNPIYPKTWAHYI